MTIYMIWFGGSSYAFPDLETDVECFGSIKAARSAFEERIHSSFFPCVSQALPEEGGPEAWLYFGDPRKQRDPYPDRTLSFGPRGGVVVGRC